MYFLPIFSLLGYCMAVRQLTRWSVEVIPFFVVTSLMSLLYLFGLFDLLKYATEALVFFGLALLALIPLYARRDDWVARHITPGFLFLILFCVFFGFFASHSHFHLWDEFSQWGARAKLLAIENNLYTQSSVLAHPDYPPGAALFCYWLFAFSHYSETVAHMAQQLLLLIPLGVFMKGYGWDRWQRAFLALSFAILILLLLHVHMASDINLYVDNVVGVYFGAMIVNYYYSKRRVSDLVFLLPAVFYFVTIKAGLVSFIILFSVIILIDQIMQRAGNFIVRVVAVLSIFLAGWLSHWSWHAFLFFHNISFAPYLPDLASVTFTPQQMSFVYHFLWAFMERLPAVIAILLVVLASVLLAQKRKKRKEIILWHIIMFIGFVFYVAALLGAFLYYIDANEGVYLASLDRYLKIYFVAWGLVAYGTMLSEWRISHFSKQEKITGVLVAFALIAFPTYLFYSYYEHLREDQQSYSFVRLRQALQPIVVAARHMIPSNAKVFVIWQDSKGFEPMVLGYALIPRNINQSPFSFGVPYSASDVWTQKYSVQKLKNAMKSYDYILLAYTDKVFWKTYQSLFPKRHKHQLVEYLICQKSGFDGFGKSGCNTQAENAYLYKNK